MPRVGKNPAVMLALSPSAVSHALGIRADEVRQAIDDGSLPVYRKGTRSRILIADVERLVRSWPQTTKRKSKRKVPSNGRS
jgi:excisionase family DNA binding protein